MKIVVVILLLVVFHGLPAQSQKPVSGKATALAGGCAVSHVGNYDTIYIKNCGIGEAQGKQIIALLKEALKNKDQLEQMTKLIASMKLSPEEDALEHLDGTVPLPPDRDLNNSEFTLTNNSSQAILVKETTCILWSVKFRETAATVGDVGISPLPYNVLLGNGGDAQQWSCPLSRTLHGAGNVVCADISWTAHFTIQSQPNKIMDKGYRFTILPGDTKWRRTANNAPTLNCDRPA